jgi:hypothetical protein
MLGFVVDEEDNFESLSGVSPGPFSYLTMSEIYLIS